VTLQTSSSRLIASTVLKMKEKTENFLTGSSRDFLQGLYTDKSRLLPLLNSKEEKI